MPGVDVPVDDVSWAAYRMPTEGAEADGTITWNATTMVLVRARAGAAVGTGWTYAPSSAGTLVGEMLAAVVTGRCALDVPGAYHAMQRAVRNAGRPGIAATAISAVDTALWDLKARLLQVRLARLIGTVRDEAPIYGSGGFTSYDDSRLTRQLEHWVHQLRIPRVKIKIAESWGTAVDRDLARIRHTRQVVGADAELYVDANGGYTHKQAIRVAHAATDLDLRWFEEPVSSDDLDGLRRVRDAIAADVTAGEYGYDLDYFRRMCATGAVDCLQVDVSRCGGITEWQRVAAVAAAHNLQVSGHCAPHLHLDAAVATANLRHLEWFHDHARIESMLFEGALTPEGGTLRPDLSLPGNGLVFRDADAAQYRVA
ncbi:enolase C-terminal domain-like protein [Plantactinospora endophytica]|uniref:Mandelate racemase n=1 Tax=Plantactinospora endophytica TaxID=673535 RepID=A0ABQ4E720_9ACTN|nr:enolase C-terminal domain-like protein [Plantactinospora endophytica]GIG90521.1 mandelate racemase [Plantactinospora endophytica]